MNIEEALELAKEIGIWINDRTNGVQFKNEKRLLVSLSIFQHVLDIADGIVVLVERNLPGVAWTLARPMHEGYVQGVWLLNHATDEQVENFIKGICPKIHTLVKKIGDEPDSGGAWIKGITEKNSKAFHNLTHGGIEHVSRRITESGVEPNYDNEEIVNLLKLRNQYYIHVGVFLLALLEDEDSLIAINEKQKHWDNSL